MVENKFSLSKPSESSKFEASGFILLYVIGIIVVAIWLLTTNQDVIAILLAATALIIVPRTPLIRKTMSPFRHVKKYLDSFAEKNKLEPYRMMPEQFDKDFYPAIANLGRLARAEYGYTGTINKVELDFYLHTYRSLIRRDVDRHEILVLKAKLPTVLPHTFVMGKDKKGSPIAHSIERTFDDSQRVKLQNDLNEHFLLFTHKRTVMDATTIWTPQLLELLRGHAAIVSVETIGRNVYVYLAPGYQSFDLQELFTFFESLIRSLQHSTETIYLKLPNNAKFPFLLSRPSGGVVKFAGKYINYALVALIFINTLTAIRWALNPDSVGVTLFFILQLLGSIALYVILLRARSQYTRTIDKRGY